MILPGHLAAGYLATEAVLHLTGVTFSPTETTTLLIYGTLAGDLPDIDLAFYYFNQKFSGSRTSSDGHRSYITHKPLFWLLISGVIAGAGALAGSSFTVTIGLLTLTGTWAHFVGDSIEDGVRWLWPFSNRLFYMRHFESPDIPGPKGTPKYYWLLVKNTALHKVTTYVEILLIALAILVAFK